MPPKMPPKQASSSISWGRRKGGDFFPTMWVTLIMIFSPVSVLFYWSSCEHYQCSLRDTAADLFLNPRTALMNLFPTPTLAGFKVFAVWFSYQVLAALFVPGPKSVGQETPAGNVLEYKTNGFNVFLLTHILFAIGGAIGLFKYSIIADNWGSLLVACNVYGYLLTFFVYLKAHLVPSHPEDCKYSGNVFYDLFYGVELNPRFGPFDFKLFHNGRPGIEAWNLINLSFMAKQYHDHGFISNSMVLMTILQMTYVVDFFYNEDWYLRTIDIAHDHMGYYLAWGDSVWLPYMYTLQGVYLSHHPHQLSWLSFTLIALLGSVGYWIFRGANHQKDRFRMTKGKCDIWGKPAESIPVTYITSDGKTHDSNLLISGFWGVARHFNYMGDLMLSAGYSLACGFNHFHPYFYFFYMIILLVHRTYRDDERCRAKYGKKWSLYCQKVPYRILPKVF
eukprot:TRINITY_DN651_c0_g2_i1.p1 TRINITY_DN651_c0_g2~~TRINITY_DN651_c0_g2_i1.p1  ORF type:complete len:487 (-),score=55.47 TRINITY_DN651_c0_g2_i1:162-1505(-)